MRRDVRRLLAMILVPLAACAAETPGTPPTVADPSTLPDLRLVPAFPDLRFERPLLLTHAGDGSGRLFVVEQAGRIFAVAGMGADARSTLFLDVRKAVRTENNEEGLLGLAFHPRFRENGTFFIHHSASSPPRGVLARFRVDPTTGLADPASGSVVLEAPKPYGNHNGASVLFGPDGHLYLSLGDGGSGGDPHGNGQSLETLLGKVLRIDVDREEGGRSYAIPADNPFVGQAGARAEIWAYGLRNVWRMSFDRATGELWAGDVGQDRYEEVDVIRRGGNYGWNVREGAHPFREGAAKGPFIDPFFEYDHRLGQSITGGHVYRGRPIPSLRGAYVFADFVSGRFWALRRAEDASVLSRVVLEQPENIASFGEDAEGELYACAFNGRIYRIEAAAPATR